MSKIQLAHLSEVSRLSPRVIRILGGNPSKFTLQGTNTYIIGTGRSRLLIDTGYGVPSWIKAVKETVASENAVISQAIITHWHHDHTDGIPHLLEAFPDCRVYKNKPDDGQLDLEDGQQFTIDGATLRTIHTPGHTQDHMCVFLEEEDALFTGDNVLGHGTGVFENLPLYISSLEKMRTLFSGRAYPGHGPEIEDGPAKVEEYIQHRKQREDQIINVLRSNNTASGSTNSWGSMEIVKVIYQDVPEELHQPAEGNVLKVLWKLHDDDKIAEDPSTGKWRLKDRPVL